MLQVEEHVSIADKNLLEGLEIGLGAEAEA